MAERTLNFDRKMLGFSVDHFNRVPHNQRHSLGGVLFDVTLGLQHKNRTEGVPHFVLGDERTFTDPIPKKIFDIADQNGLPIGKILSITIPAPGTPAYIMPSLKATVDDALDKELDGVAIQVHTEHPKREKMMTFLHDQAARATTNGLQVIAVVYPRADLPGGQVETFDSLRKSSEPSERNRYTDMLVSGVAQVADLSVNAIKVPWCSDPSEIVAAAKGVPLLVAGGERVSAQRTLEDVSQSMQRGYRGAVIGRAIFDDPFPGTMALALQSVIQHDMEPGRALTLAGYGN